LAAASVAAALVAGLVAVPAVAGSGGSTNVTTTSFGVPDVQLRDMVVGALAADYRTRSAGVGVTVGNGRITLIGSVSPQVHSVVDELVYSVLGDLPVAVPLPNLNSRVGLNLPVPDLDLPLPVVGVGTSVAVPGLSQLLYSLGVLDLLYDALP
jgi:hypothetical protein